MIIWVPAGDNRPYEAPSRNGRKKVYWVRPSACAVEATGDLRRQLLEQAAKIPFDDRRNLTGTAENISPILVKKFLADIRSHLSEMDFPPQEIFRKLRLVVPVNDHEIPRNVALLFFNDDPGIKLEHLRGGSIPAVPARNRRIGEFLKDLRLAEGRGTGIPKINRKMHENGSPDAVFDFDEERTYFRVILPVHPRYQVLHALREAAQFWAIGEKDKAISHLERALGHQPGSGALVSQLIEYTFGVERLDLAKGFLDEFEKNEIKSEASLPFLTMARLLIDRQRMKEASVILKRILASNKVYDIIELAILKKRTKDFEGAHRLFARAYSLNPDDPKILQEFANTKINLARSKPYDVKKRLDKEAKELLRRAIQLCDDNMRKAWCWFDLARTLDWLRSPRSEVEEAYLQALSLLPSESRFKNQYERWKNRSSANKH